MSNLINHHDESNAHKESTLAPCETTNKWQNTPENICSVHQCEQHSNYNQSLLVDNMQQDDVTITDQLISDDCWPGDRIFDIKYAPDHCISLYDGYLANLVSQISGLTISATMLPNIAPQGITIDSLKSHVRCSIPSIASTHVLSCFDSNTFFSSRTTTSSATLMNSRYPGRKVFLIIGAGPAGLFMAIQCLLRGHAVTLIEQRKAYNRSIACGLFETEIKFFEFIGLPSCIFPCVTNYTKTRAMYIPDVEELMLKIAMKLGALVYLGCQFDATHQSITSFSASDRGIRCWDGLPVYQETYTMYDVLVYATGNAKSIPLNLFGLKSPRPFSQVFQEFQHGLSYHHLPKDANLAPHLRRLYHRSYSYPPIQSVSNHQQTSFDSSSPIERFLFDTSYEGGIMIFKRLLKEAPYLNYWLRTDRQQDILSLSQHPLFAMVAHIPASIFAANQPQKQVSKLPADWIFVPCFQSLNNVNDNQIHSIQFEGPLPIHHDLDVDRFPVYQLANTLLQNYLKVPLNENQWEHWHEKDTTWTKYSQHSLRIFRLQFETLLQEGRLCVKRTETGAITLDHARSSSSMWGTFTDPINFAQKEFLIIGDNLCTPYYRFGIGLHNATRAIQAYFNPDPKERLRQLLDFEATLIKQIFLTLFSQSRSLETNRRDRDLLKMIYTSYKTYRKSLCNKKHIHTDVDDVSTVFEGEDGCHNLSLRSVATIVIWLMNKFD